MRGLGDERKRRKIFNYIKKHTSVKAVVFLQERHSTKKHENLWKYQKKVCDLEKQVVETKGNSESTVAEYENAKNELEKLYDYITNRIILRSKAHWYEEGEINTKYFLSLEKNNKAKSHIRKVIDSNGEEITDQGNILKEIQCFYSNLYSRKSVKT